MRFLPVTCVLLQAAALAAETVHRVAPETGLSTWQWRDGGVLVHLTQITPDQARAFFLARGFPRDAADRYASACVFMTILRNESAETPVSFDLHSWRASADGRTLAFRLRSDWLREWAAQGLSQAARIAFEWSQYPEVQRFEVGDWNQGMTSVMLPHGSTFDLAFEWQAGGVTHAGLMMGVRCADANL